MISKKTDSLFGRGEILKVTDDLRDLIAQCECPECMDLNAVIESLFQEFGPNPKPEAIKCWEDRAIEKSRAYHPEWFMDRDGHAPRETEIAKAQRREA
jgi:hypothetical protein